MTLMPAYYTTTNLKKRKSRKSAKQIRLEEEHQAYLKSMGIRSRSSVGLEQQSSKLRVTGSSPVETSSPITYHPSMAKKKEKVYTGTEIIGIAQMHKSNAIPVRSKKSAEEVAKMRRC